MLTIKYHSSFKMDYKRVVKRDYDIKLMEDIINKLAEGKKLPKKTKTMFLPAIFRIPGVPYHSRLAHSDLFHK